MRWNKRRRSARMKTISTATGGAERERWLGR
jgi:hypothetical protein